MKLQGWELSPVTGYPLRDMLVALYANGDHRVQLAETHTDTEGRWYFILRKPGTYDVCVQRLRDDDSTSTKWIVGLRVDAPRRYSLRRRSRTA